MLRFGLILPWFLPLFASCVGTVPSFETTACCHHTLEICIDLNSAHREEALSFETDVCCHHTLGSHIGVHCDQDEEALSFENAVRIVRMLNCCIRVIHPV
jgi:hypothetical protein